MADELPTADDAVPSFLHALTWACVFAGVDAVFAGRWAWSGGGFIAALVSHSIGIKWEHIKAKFSGNDWVLWNNRVKTALRVAQLLMALTALGLAISVYYHARQLFSKNSRQTAPQTVPQIVPQTAPQTTKTVHPRTSRPTSQPSQPTTSQSSQPSAVPLPIERVDWHDKQNWRRYLHIGMTRSEVRQLFGEPEHVWADELVESWDYGHGSVVFYKEGPEPKLDSWDEP